jgi:ribosomal protein L5
MKIIKYPNPETFEELSRRPEMDRGQLEVTVVTTATNDDEARTLLELMGMPFRRT